MTFTKNLKKKCSWQNIGYLRKIENYRFYDFSKNNSIRVEILLYNIKK